MRNLPFLIIILISNTIFGQNKWETFIVNEKVGIVEFNSLSEIKVPKSYKRVILFNDDYFTYIENDSLKILSKITGTWSKPIQLRKYSPLIKLNDNKYLFSKIDNKLGLIDTLFNPVYTFEKDYEKIIWFHGDKYSFFGVANKENIDIFQFSEKSNKVEFYKTIIAKDYIHTNNGENEKVIIFYGGKKTYVFDKNCKDKVYNKQFGIDDRIGLYELVDPDIGNTVEMPLVESTVSENIDYKSGMFKFKETKNGKNIYNSDDSSFDLKIDEGYILYKNSFNEFTIMKEFKKGNRTSYSSKYGFWFKIDKRNLRALIPLKYQREMGLILESKN